MKRVICFNHGSVSFFFSSAILFAEKCCSQEAGANRNQLINIPIPTTGVTLTITGAWKKQPLPDSINKNQVVWE